ncbi:citrate synthase-lysine N-methyltransferase CSKMT, mitochondrial-like isoform X2 [Saccoglossus kowalevskii]
MGIDLLNGMSKQSTWNRFYKMRQEKGEKSFDWFVKYDDIKESLEQYMPNDCAVQPFQLLDIGCGTSDFSSKLFSDIKASKLLYCIDFSQNAISHLVSLNMDSTTSLDHQIQFIIADATSLPFTSSTFDLVIDKGTLDAVLRNDNGADMAVSAISEAIRVLKTNGHFLQISDEQPDTRFELLQQIAMKYNCQLSVNFKQIDTSFGMEYFIYTINKTVSS